MCKKYPPQHIYHRPFCVSRYEPEDPGRTSAHRTYTDGVLYFKTTSLGKEDSLGCIKEHAMHTLADIMWGRGIAEATFLTIARHTTIDPHTTLLPVATKAGFDSPAQYDAIPERLEVDADKQQWCQRAVQAAVRVPGALLDDVIGTPATGDARARLLSSLEPRSAYE